MDSNHYVAIMAGGVGSRFWPASRVSRPKQFLDIADTGQSLIQQTVARLSRIVPLSNVLIVSNRLYRDLILEQLPEIQPNQLLLEPSRNNTAPCVAYTALHLYADNPQATFAVIPADHMIKDISQFAAAMTQGMQLAAARAAIVTLGVQPSRPDTGYGYINYDASSEEHGVFKVKSFKEKPDAATAQSYLDDGGYLWNAGIFIWSVDMVIQSFRKYAPDIINILTEDQAAYGRADEQAYIDRVYPRTPSISVDYAILEHAEEIYTIPVDMGWSDLGTWNALYQYADKNDHDNVVHATHSEVLDTSGSLIKINNPDRLIVVKGLTDYIIVDDDDVLLIYPRNDEQSIKQLRTRLKDKRFE
jgi:Mannose-1-phosphate guanylyltransferase